MLRKLADSFLDKYGDRLAVLGAFLIPIKLSLSLIVIVPLTVATLCSSRTLELKNNHLVQSLLLFFTFAAIAAFFGIRPLKSLKEVLGLLFYASAYLPFFFAANRKGRDIIIALLCGQALAGLHSVADSALNWGMPRFFPGRVTESGQLAIAVFGLLAVLTICCREGCITMRQRGLSLALFIGLILCGFSNHIHNAGYTALALSAVAAICAWLLVLIAQYWRAGGKERCANLVIVIAPILAAALILNLKRGPWAGVFLGACYLLWRFRRRLILPIFLAGIGVVVGVSPIRDRVLESSENFFIKGGRNTIWETALDVSVRFPLGVGVGNASVLRDFSPDVQEGLSHFHSNPLNILAETGWVGLFLFGAFIVRCVREGLSKKDNFFAALSVAAVICWQVAGLVEYNIGDTEVLLAAVAVLGAIGAQVNKKTVDI